jgi:hypothetical protein
MDRQLPNPRILISFGFGKNNIFTDNFEKGTMQRQNDQNGHFEKGTIQRQNDQNGQIKIRDKLVYIHIPKTGGTFILNTIFQKKDLIAEHFKITNYDCENKIIFTTVRKPINFYNSLYNFFKKPNHPISNSFQFCVQKYDNINTFIKTLLNEKKKLTNVSSSFDKYYINSNNKYGLLTNYFLYFFDYKGGDIDTFFINLKKKVYILKQENLKEDTINLCNKFNLNYDNKKIDTKINKNNYTQYVDKATEDLIKEKDYLIYKHFY